MKVYGTRVRLCIRLQEQLKHQWFPNIAFCSAKCERRGNCSSQLCTAGEGMESLTTRENMTSVQLYHDVILDLKALESFRIFTT